MSRCAEQQRQYIITVLYWKELVPNLSSQSDNTKCQVGDMTPIERRSAQYDVWQCFFSKF